MRFSFQSLYQKYGWFSFVILALGIYVLYMFYMYFVGRSLSGPESMDDSAMNPAYSSSGGSRAATGSGNPMPAVSLGDDETFASAQGIGSPQIANIGSCSTPNIQNPSELLPKPNGSEWSQLSPSSNGELSNISLLKAGYHIGIDTIGQSLRNANLQERSEPANPQLYVGPWNQSTITPDFMRPPLEIGSGMSQ
jgi:hypothetical protein